MRAQSLARMLFRIAQPSNLLWTVPGDNTLFAPEGPYDFTYAGQRGVR
jgi:hypothetical protein